MYNSFRLARQAEIDIASLTNGKSNKDVHHGSFDILISGKIRIQIKSATLNKNLWRFAFNDWGGRIKERSDILVCVGYDSEREKILRLLCIPSKKIPQWRTSISLTLNRKNKVRNTWDKYLIKPKDLLNQIHSEYKTRKV